MEWVGKATRYLTLSLSNNQTCSHSYNRLTPLPSLSPTNPPSFSSSLSGAKPSARLLLFSRGCIIVTNYRSMARRAIKRLCSGKEKRMKQGQQRVEGLWRVGQSWRGLIFFLFSFFFAWICAAVERRRGWIRESGKERVGQIWKMADQEPCCDRWVDSCWGEEGMGSWFGETRWCQCILGDILGDRMDPKVLNILNTTQSFLWFAVIFTYAVHIWHQKRKT